MEWREENKFIKYGYVKYFFKNKYVYDLKQITLRYTVKNHIKMNEGAWSLDKDE